MLAQTSQTQILTPVSYSNTNLPPRRSDKISENVFFIVALEDAEQVITCSQADQALCDEAENGRLH